MAPWCALRRACCGRGAAMSDLTRPKDETVTWDEFLRYYNLVTSVCSESSSDGSVAAGSYACACTIGYAGITCANGNISMHHTYIYCQCHSHM